MGRENTNQFSFLVLLTSSFQFGLISTKLTEMSRKVLFPLNTSVCPNQCISDTSQPRDVKFHEEKLE